MQKQSASSIVELLKTIVYAVIIAVGIRTFAYEPFSIPSGSMIPTLLVGDYLFVSKFSYGYSRYSLPWGLPLFNGRIFGSEPERGDVVVFKLPSDNRTDYIKRIVGMPGDKVQMINGRLHINGAVAERESAGEFNDRSPYGGVRKFTRYRETLPGGVSHYIYEASDREPVDNTGVYEVPADHFFALGDNRDSSRDSRFVEDVGFIPLVNLVGRAEFIFFSVDGSVLAFWNWYRTLRVSRIFQSIE